MASPRGAQAQSDDEKKAAAEALFDDARKAAKAGNYAAACPMFAESQKLDAGIGTLLHLGDCYEKLGKTASAWATFREASSAARAANQPDRVKTADERAAALEPRLSKLTVNVANPPPGLVVKRGTSALLPALYGKAIPVDPGAHVISAEAPGFKPWKQEVKVDGQALVNIPALAPEDKAGAPASSAPAAPPTTAAPPATTQPPADSGQPPSYRTYALIAGGVGVVATGVGAFFGLRAMSTYDERQKNCTNNVCNPRGLSLDSDARSQALLSNIFFGVGAAGLVTGAALFFIDPQRKSALAPVVGPSFAGLSVAGSL